MDINKSYDTTNMSPDEIMKLFEQIKWNKIKSNQKKNKKINTNDKLVLITDDKIFTKNDISIESPEKNKTKYDLIKSYENKQILSQDKIINRKPKFLHANNNSNIKDKPILLPEKIINKKSIFLQQDKIINCWENKPIFSEDKIISCWKNNKKNTNEWDMWSTPIFLEGILF